MLASGDTEPQPADPLATATEESSGELAVMIQRRQAMIALRNEKASENISNGALAVITVGVITPLIDVTYGGQELTEKIGRAGPFILPIWLFLGLGLYWVARKVLGDIE